MNQTVWIWSSDFMKFFFLPSPTFGCRLSKLMTKFLLSTLSFFPLVQSELLDSEKFARNWNCGIEREAPWPFYRYYLGISCFLRKIAYIRFRIMKRCEFFFAAASAKSEISRVEFINVSLCERPFVVTLSFTWHVHLLGRSARNKKFTFFETH